MKKTIRIFYFFIVMVLIASLCRGAGSDASLSNKEGKSPGAAKTVETANVASSKDRGLTIGTLILTVGSSSVYWPEFLFWLNYIEKYYRSYHNLDKITDWSATQNGMGLKEFFLSNAVAYACKDRAIEAKAKELGIELSVRDLAEIEQMRKKNIQIYGSESEYLHIIRSMYISEDVFNYLSKMDYLGNHLFAHLYGEKGEKCTDEEVSSYVNKQGYVCAKYIFISNTDSEGKELGEEKRAKNYKLLEGILGRLKTSSTPLILFNTLMKEHSNDREILNYPDGRLVSSGGISKEFGSSCMKLKEKEYSGIVKADEGYYIILRMPIFPDMTADSGGNTLRYRTAYDYLFKNQIEDLASKMKVKYEDAYYKIDVEGLANN